MSEDTMDSIDEERPRAPRGWPDAIAESVGNVLTFLLIVFIVWMCGGHPGVK